MTMFLLIFAGALAGSLLITPLVIRLALRRGLVDAPGARKVHTRAVPRLGGIGIALPTLVLTILVLAMNHSAAADVAPVRAQALALLLGGGVMLTMGLIDDVRGLPARFKLLVQLLAAGGVCAAGIRIEHVQLGHWPVDFGLWSWPLTIIWIVGISNAMNLIDGLDGLAGGIAAVTCGVIAVFAGFSGLTFMTLLMLALLGSLTGFLVFNFNPARIFMGDGGTYFIGFLISAGSILSASKAATVVGLAMPALALGVPICDTLFSMFRRMLERRSMFAPDRGHIHHRLLAMGLHQRHAVAVIYAFTVLSAAMGMFMMVTRDAATLLIFLSLLTLTAMLFRLAGAIRLRQALAAIGQRLRQSRRRKCEIRKFETMQLLVREATDAEERWQQLCHAASEMDADTLTLPASFADGPAGRTWRRSPSTAPGRRVLTVMIPVQDDQRRAQIDLAVDDDVETAVWRSSLFCRLLSECALGKTVAVAARGVSIANRKGADA